MIYYLSTPPARVTMSRQTARDCSAPGQDASEAVTYAIRRRLIRFHGCTPRALGWDLRESGGWTAESVAEETPASMRLKIGWIAACTIREEMNR